MRALIVAAILAAGPAFAGDRIARQGEDWVRVSEVACASDAARARAAALEPQYRGRWALAVAQFQGRLYQACWRPFGDGIHLVYEDGDQGIVPAKELKPVTEI